MSIYDKLAEVLAGRTGSSWKVSFSELESLIGVKLPSSAFKYPGWWSNNPSNNAMTKIWRKAGWRTEQVDVPGQTLVFRRDPRKAAEPDAAGLAGRSGDVDHVGARERQADLEYKAIGLERRAKKSNQRFFANRRDHENSGPSGDRDLAPDGRGTRAGPYERKSAAAGDGDWLAELEAFVARTVRFNPGFDPRQPAMPDAERSAMEAGMAAEWDALYGRPAQSDAEPHVGKSGAS